MALVVSDGRRAEDKIAHLQCSYCTATLYVNGQNCQMSHDSSGKPGVCNLDEIGWFKGSFSIGKGSKPCCGSCLVKNPAQNAKQANKVKYNFWKFHHQICPGCTVYAEIDGAPAFAVAASHAPAAAAHAATPAAQPPPPPFAAQPPPPPLQPPNANPEMHQLRTRVAVLEAQQVSASVMTQNFEETMVNLQLAMESKMHEQEQRMVERLNMRDDTVQLLEAQIERMSKTIEELQLQLARKAREEVHVDCVDTLSLPHSDVIDGKWDILKAFTAQGEELFSDDYEAWMHQ